MDKDTRIAELENEVRWLREQLVCAMWDIGQYTKLLQERFSGTVSRINSALNQSKQPPTRWGHAPKGDTNDI